MMTNRRRVSVAALIVLLALLLLAWVQGAQMLDRPLSGTVTPSAPRAGDPVVARYVINNPLPYASRVEWLLYVNGRVALEESRLLAAQSSHRLEYVLRHAPEAGQQTVFDLRVKADAGHWEQVLAAPPYGPQVISSIASFASFASLSSSAMSFIATREYYQGSFDSGYFNMGLIVALVLLAVLVFMEITGGMATPSSPPGGFGAVQLLRRHSRILCASLLAIIVGMFFTKVALIILQVMN